MQKLHLALDIYRGLGAIPATRADTLTKVSSMLLHPFPKVSEPHQCYIRNDTNAWADSYYRSGDVVVPYA